jgi:hypothetical protein
MSKGTEFYDWKKSVKLQEKQDKILQQREQLHREFAKKQFQVLINHPLINGDEKIAKSIMKSCKVWGVKTTIKYYDSVIEPLDIHFHHNQKAKTIREMASKIHKAANGLDKFQRWHIDENEKIDPTNMPKPLQHLKNNKELKGIIMATVGLLRIYADQVVEKASERSEKDLAA